MPLTGVRQNAVKMIDNYIRQLFKKSRQRDRELFYILIMMMTIKFEGFHMENYCYFSKDHKCLKCVDYQLTLFELAATDETFEDLPE
ncbi:MAG: hypothetical protein SO415_05385 [Oliverpabstia sp.]|nr:hypothetical protein [Oliverpabstia sp.]